MSSYPVVFDDGSKAYVPEANLSKALSDGGKLAQRMHFDDGSRALVPMDRIKDAMKDGGQIIGENVAPPQPKMHEVTEPPPGVAYAPYRIAKTMLGLPGAIFHSVADAPRTPEEAGFEAGASGPGAGVLSGPAAGRLALASKRLLYDPQAATYQRGQEIENAANQKFGEPFQVPSRVLPQPLARALYGPSGNPMAMFQPSGRTKQERAQRETAAAYKMASLVPLIGPLAAQLATSYVGDPTSETASEEAPYGTERDPAGALAEGVGYALLPKAEERVKAEVAPLLPTRSDIMGGARAIGKTMGVGYTPEEMLTKAGGPSVQGQEGANLPTAIRRAAPRLVEQNRIRKIENVQDLADGAYMASKRVWNDGYEPQIQRHATATFDASAIGDQIRGGVDEGMRDLFPEQAKKADAFANKFQGPITLQKANSYLKALNAELKSYYKMTPEARAAAGLTDGSISAYEDAAEGLRDHIDKTLESLGEQDPAGLRQEYGALTQIQRVFGKRAVVTGRQAPLNLPQILSLAGGATEAGAAVMAGHPLGAVLGALPMAATTAAKHLTSPDVLVRRAIRGFAERGEEARPLEGGGTPPPSTPAPTTPPVVPPWTNTGQGNLQFGMQPSQTSGFPEAQVTPAPGSQVRMPWEVAPPTPTPAEKAPAAAPKAKGAPSYSPEQSAAIDKAKALARSREDAATDEAQHEAHRQAARRPELDTLNGQSTTAANKVNGEFTPERNDFQQRVAEKKLGPEKPAEENPTVVFEGGGAASGKTGLTKRIQKETGIKTVLNPDDNHAELPEYDMLRQSDPLGAAARMHEEAGVIQKKAVAEAMRRRQSIIIDKVNGDAEDLKKQIQDFKDAGYRVEVHYLDRDMHDALGSMVGRFEQTGRWVPPNVLREGHENAAHAYHEIAPLADRHSLTHSGANGHELVADSEGVYNKVLHEEHRAKGALRNERLRLRSDGEGTRGNEGGGQGGPAPGEAVQGKSGAVGKGTGAAGEGAPAEQGQGGQQQIAGTLPPKDKPVTLALGGAFNPSHLGHVKAIEDSVAALESQGYKVAKVVVAPTPDKLLKAKLGDEAHSLQDRAEIARKTFPETTKSGVPIEVSTEPAQEVESMTGKAKRTQLADNLRRSNPGTSVVAISGEDATVPGAPAGHSQLYQGTEGHTGYHYITAPRPEGGMSSSKIRAAMKAGEEPPGMTPEAAAHLKGLQPAGKQEVGEPSAVRLVKTADLHADPKRFQWRQVPRSTIPEGAKWDQAKAGPIDVWRDPQDGKLYVVDGHHRLNHAINTGTEKVEVRMHDFPDAAAAKRYGALRNLEQGNATPFDAALYLRESGTKPEQLDAQGINLTGDTLRKGSALANLSDQMWEQYRTGQLDEAKAVAVGKLGDPAQQAALAQIAKSHRLSAGDLEQQARRIEQQGNTSTTSMGLFGPEETSVSNAVATGRLATKIENALAADETALKFIGKADKARRAALERGKNIIDVKQSSQEAMVAAALAEHFRKVQYRSGPVGSLLEEAGRRITQGEKLDAVFKELYPKIRDAVAEDLGTGK